MRKLICILFLTLISIENSVAQYPSVGLRIYWAGMETERESWGEYKLGYWHKDTFQVNWGVVYKNPAVGYPYHSSNTIGVNDTVRIAVGFDNGTDENYYIGSSTPEDWFYPVIYDPYVDVFTAPMLADTSNFKYRFEHWVKSPEGTITTKPDTIFSSSVHRFSDMYGMVYSMWGLAPGTFRVVLMSTTSKPADIELNLDASQNLYTMSIGQDLEDTLNSYCAIAINALSRLEFTLFNTYVNNIFALNSQSLPGWALRYQGYDKQGDTTNALVALDSMLYNLENRVDPLIPDTSRMTPIHDYWLKQWKVDYEHFQERMQYPLEWIVYPP